MMLPIYAVCHRFSQAELYWAFRQTDLSLFSSWIIQGPVVVLIPSPYGLAYLHIVGTIRGLTLISWMGLHQPHSTHCKN
jgi:hypothetical protein